MRWTYSTYSNANALITAGIILGSAVFVIIVIGCNRAGGFRTLLQNMFGITYTRSEINLYGNDFKIEDETKWFYYIPHFCLWLTIVMIIATTLLVFVDRLILNVVYLRRNRQCPDDGNMDCYSTFQTIKYFHCKSSDIFIPESMGSVVCYKWFKNGFSTLDVLEQIGLCTGLFQVYTWIVEVYLRLLLWVYAFPDPRDSEKKYAHPILATILTIVLLSSPLIVLIILAVYRANITGLTIAVMVGVLVIEVSMLILVGTWRRNKRLVNENINA